MKQQHVQVTNGAHKRTPSVSMRRRGWPVSTAPPPDAVDLGVKGWTNVLDQALLGWEVFDVIKIFEDDDNFFADWHESLGDTCGPPLRPPPAAPPLRPPPAAPPCGPPLLPPPAARTRRRCAAPPCCPHAQKMRCTSMQAVCVHVRVQIECSRGRRHLGRPHGARWWHVTRDAPLPRPGCPGHQLPGPGRGHCAAAAQGQAVAMHSASRRARVCAV